MKEYFRVERLTRHISFVIARGMILLHSPSSYCADRHGSLLQRPAFPGNLFRVNVEPGNPSDTQTMGTEKGYAGFSIITSHVTFSPCDTFTVLN
jgi:hypothetical protein